MFACWTGIYQKRYKKNWNTFFWENSILGYTEFCFVLTSNWKDWIRNIELVAVKYHTLKTLSAVSAYPSVFFHPELNIKWDVKEL